MNDDDNERSHWAEDKQLPIILIVAVDDSRGRQNSPCNTTDKIFWMRWKPGSICFNRLNKIHL